MANIGFIGAGGIARAHAFCLNSLKYYYNDAASVNFVSVTSANATSRESFAKNYGFSRAEEPESFIKSQDIDTVFILGPNKVHYEHFNHALNMPSVKHIYLEKPVCSTMEEEQMMLRLLEQNEKKINIQVGFQYHLTSSVREALAFWRSGILGKPIHFDLKYYHGDYLQKTYRNKRQTRLTPAPDGGAMADLGSHGISLLMAFFNNNLRIMSAMQAGSFEDVPSDSDLFSALSLYDPTTKAVGIMSASRISSGTGDLIHLEIFAEKGALKYSSHHPDYFEYFLEESGNWVRQPVGSNYKPISGFPSGHVPPGWLRAMIHAHYIFLGGKDDRAAIPDLRHGLAVQRIVRETAEHLKHFRRSVE